MINLEGLGEWAGLGGADLSTARVVLAGIPYDGSAVYRKGAAAAPAAMRRLSPVIPPVDERGRSLSRATVHDLGDLDLGDSVEALWGAAADRLAEVPPDRFLTVLGGDHCAAIPVLAAQARRHPGLALLWIDAHPDLCDFSRGGPWTCGCALRRGLRVAGLSPGSVAMAGCRDFDPEEVAYIAAERIAMVTSADLASDFGAAVDTVLKPLSGRPVHVSLDIDVLDPAYAPGTEIACAGGLTTRQVLDLLAATARVATLVGLDVCEVSPPLDHTDVTSLAALKLIFETWGLAVGAGGPASASNRLAGPG
ncbi:MAG: arginase family protein [Candidatus Dormibacteraeota bacterium]|nr:arginase family protein [Candidatus Dormibacteraeota bacterium]